MVANSTIADQAVAAAERGWYVFPLLPGSKRPAVHDFEHKALADPVLVHRGWRCLPGPDYNYGIACGPSGLVVIDPDVSGDPMPPPWDAMPGVVDGTDVLAALAEQHGAPWPSTHLVQTPRGGWHLYFASTDPAIRNSASELGPDVDVRGHGGYIVGTGSVVDERGEPNPAKHGTYVTLDDSDPVPLPGWLAKLAAKPAAGTAAVPPLALADLGQYVRVALESELHAVATAWQGCRNSQLNKSAYALARFVAAGRLDSDAAVSALTQAGLAAGLTVAEVRHTIASAFVARGVRRG